MIDWQALYKISLGLYILGAKDKSGRDVGSIVDAVMIAANKPCALAISCTNISYTKECLLQTGRLSLSVLPKDVPPEIIANFGFQSGRTIDKWQGVSTELFDGLPVWPRALAYVSARVIHHYPLESNTIFIAEILKTKNLISGAPILYADYRGGFKDDVIKAFQQQKEKKMKKWVCTVCNYVYDGEIPFEKLPDDWVCPLCGVDKSFFEERDV